MAQLDVFSIDDNFIIMIMASLTPSYFSEEIEATVESVVAYIYSSVLASKKRKKLFKTVRPAGDVVGAIYASWSFLAISNSRFTILTKTLEDKPMWQDPVFSKWVGDAGSKSQAKLDEKHGW